MDYGTYNYDLETDAGKAQMKTLLKGFIEDYEAYAGDGKNLYFIFGDTTSINILAYQELTEIVNVAGSEMTIDGMGSKVYNLEAGETKIEIEIDNVGYQFDLNGGYNFYFVISQEIEGEKHVVTG